MKTLAKIAAAILVAALCILFALSRTRAEVPVATARTGTAIDAVTGTVKVFANIDLRIKTEVQGRIASVPVKIGQRVAKGEALVILDSEDIAQQIRENVIRLRAAQERIKLPFPQVQDIQSIQEDIARLAQMVEFGRASEADVERRRRDLSKVQTDLDYQRIARDEQIQLFEATVDRLKYQLERMTIVAPMEGTVVEQLAFEGDFLWTGNEVVRLVSPGRWVELKLAEEDSANVREGQKANVHLAVYPGRSFVATVTALSTTANADDKTRVVFMSIDEPDEVLVPGLTGEGVLVRAEHPGAVLVPRRALVGNRLYVVKDGVVRIRRVTPGFSGLELVEIASGLSAGEQVVLEGQSALRDGDRVVPVEGE